MTSKKLKLVGVLGVVVVVLLAVLIFGKPDAKNDNSLPPLTKENVLQEKNSLSSGDSFQAIKQDIESTSTPNFDSDLEQLNQEIQAL